MKGFSTRNRRKLIDTVVVIVLSTPLVYLGTTIGKGDSALGAHLAPAPVLLLFLDSLWCALARTRGGLNRIRIIEALKERPYNAYQISEKLNVDYRTTRHHLEVLLRNDILTCPDGDSYGAMYFLSEDFKKHAADYEKVKECVLEELDEELTELGKD